MSDRRFDRVMINVEIGHSLDLAPLKIPERWCFVAGILPIAAKAPIRGRLLIGDRRATEADIARQAEVPLSVARSALHKLRAAGLLEDDDEFGCEHLRTFVRWNPPPKKDSTAAERQQRRRDKLKAAANANANGPITGPVTGPSRVVTDRDERDDHGTVTPQKEEGEKKNPPSPPQAGGTIDPSSLEEARQRLRAVAPEIPSTGRHRDIAAAGERFDAFRREHFPDGDEGTLRGLVGTLRGRSVEPSVDAIRRYAAERPVWATAVGPVDVDGAA